MLKLIPAERPEGRGGKKHKNPKLQQKNTLEVAHHRKILKIVGYKLMGMAKKSNPSAEEVTDLIHGLHKSIICLEKQRQKNLRGKRRKK